MKIQVDNYTLYSDMYCFYITEKQPIDSRNKQAKRDTKEVRVGGYSTTLPLLLRSFKENKLKLSGARNMEELLEDLAKISLDMDMLYKAATDKGLDDLRQKYGKNA